MLTTRLHQREELYDIIESVKREIQSFCTDEEHKELEKLASKCLENQFKVVVVGEYNRGKSTLINALLGSEVLPTAIIETTDVISVIRYGETTRLCVEFSDGRKCDYIADKETLKSFSALSGNDNSSINSLSLYYPSEILSNDITIVDTPGVNDMRFQRNEITYAYLPNADCVIYVLDATAPLKKTEFTFLQEYIIKNSIPSFVIVINKVDAIDQNQRPSLIENIKNKLLPLGLSDSLNIFVVSSKWAINGIMFGDKELLDRSGIEYFSHWLQNELEDSRKNQIRIESLRKKLSHFIENIIFKLDTQLEVEQVELNQLESLYTELLKYRIALDGKLEELLNYITQDRYALEDRLLKTISRRINESFFQIRSEIDSLKSGINNYASNVLPNRLNSIVKNWIDLNSTGIEEYLKFSISNIKKYFLSNFSFTVLIHSDGKIHFQTDNRLGLNLVDSDSVQIEKINKISFGMGTLLAGGLLAVGTGGLGLTILLPSLASGNFIANKFIQPYLIDKLNSSQKNDLLHKLPSLKEKVLHSVIESLRSSCEEFYDNLKIEIENEYNKVYSAGLVEIENRIKQFNQNKNDLIENFDKYRGLKSALLKILETIKDDTKWK